ncbi:hypothetical protein EY643_03355 [Halioglobus maricola]|uniref:Sulfatase N-terminal domain-containing protein n=1 Tax=Halioglobus maricola TaxID=2601894 RepID=A0A5P9NHT7_9GAMM|nr:sulfatase-like hydrolase/transferase [Halioglobus maricola]QFU74764.1 hypothetical protein EY643_03355 [Halioglobus maricola]
MIRAGSTYVLLVLALFLSACDKQGTEAPTAPDKPNILFILVDDMGYGDLGINGSSASLTPALDQFARQGIRYTRNYVDSTCAASRAGILTGRPPLQLGFRPQGFGINPGLETLPELLRSAGYSTHHFGKWHLGHIAEASWPLAQGFDSFFGFLTQFLLRGPHTAPEFSIGRPTYHNPWLQRNDEFPEPYKGHLSNIVLARVLEFIESADARTSPWFLNYWTYLPHHPLQPGARFAQRFEDTPAGRYKAMLAQMDDNISQVLAALELAGLSERTLVMVVSDNGGTARHIDSNAPFSGTKMSFQEGGVRTPMLVRWPDGIGSGTVDSTVVSYLDYLPTLVTAAGGQLPAGLRGRDLRALAEGSALEPRALYWDAGTFEHSAWSILSSDGRWRVHRNFLGDPVLNDFSADPSGTKDLALERPDVLAAQVEAFQRWRRSARELRLAFEINGDNGRGILTGEDFQRAPGATGFSFGLGLVPANAASDAKQVIVSQPGKWELWQEDGQIFVRAAGLEIAAPALPPGRCSSIVVSSEINFSYIAPQKSYAILDLYIDGQLAGSARKSKPVPPEGGFSIPTYIGMSEDGQLPFHGRLGRPVILNEKLVSDEVADPWIQNGVSGLAARLCDSVATEVIEPGQ